MRRTSESEIAIQHRAHPIRVAQSHALGRERDVEEHLRLVGDGSTARDLPAAQLAIQSADPYLIVLHIESSIQIFHSHGHGDAGNRDILQSHLPLHAELTGAWPGCAQVQRQFA